MTPDFRGALIVTSALVLLASQAPAHAQDLVRVYGTISWDSLTPPDDPWVATGGTVFGLVEPVELVISGSGTEGTYDGFAFPGPIQLYIELRQCGDPGCFMPGNAEPGSTLQFYSTVATVESTDTQVDGGPPEGYALEPISGGVVIPPDSTFVEGYVKHLTIFFDETGVLAFHWNWVPLVADDPARPTYSTWVGHGSLDYHTVGVQFAECFLPSEYFGGLPFIVTAGEPIVLEDVVATRACSMDILELTLETPTTAARVGTLYPLRARVLNQSGAELFDVRVRWELTGPARARGWYTSSPFFCSGSGFTEADGVSTSDCATFLDVGQTGFAMLDVHALAPGPIEVKVSAWAGDVAVPPDVELASLTAEASPGGADVDAGGPGEFFAQGRQYWLNFVGALLVNAGPEDAEDVELRVSAQGLPVSFQSGAAFVIYRDIFFGEDFVGLDCAVETPSGDFVCHLGRLESWQQADVGVSWHTDELGTVEFAVTASTSSDDPRPENNAFTVSVDVAPVPLADITTSQEVLTPRPAANEPIDLLWRIHNAGPVPARATGFFFAPGIESFEIVDSPVFARCIPPPPDILCIVEEPLAPGDTVVVHVRARPPMGGEYRSVSDVFTPGGDVFDPDLTNNVFELITDVTGPQGFSREEVVLFGSLRIPCIPGDGFFSIFATSRTHEKLRLRQQSDGISGFLHSTQADHADSGQGFVFTDAGEFLTFELVRGHQSSTERLTVRKSPAKPVSDELRFSEHFTWREVLPEGSEGEAMTMRWHLTFAYEMDELGRFINTLEKTDFKCRR